MRWESLLVKAHRADINVAELGMPLLQPTATRLRPELSFQLSP